MGDTRDDKHSSAREAWTASRQDWADLVEHGARYQGSQSTHLRAGGPPPESTRESPLIIDTDIGGDPDDAIALALAARSVPQLALVITCDERDGDRARFARRLLDLLDRRDVRVVAGSSLGATRYFAIDGLLPDEVPPQPTTVIDAVTELCGRAAGSVHWVGMGPLSNLAAVLAAQPDLATQLTITQMGGALRYRDPTRAEHNFRLDPSAAIDVLREAHRPRLVTSDVTFVPDIAIDRASDMYRRLSTEDAPEWARLLTSHLDRWFATAHPSTFQHDPLTLSAALELPFVDFDYETVALDEQARMSRDASGTSIFLSRAARYDAFLRWMGARLDPRMTQVAGAQARPTDG